MCASVRVWYAPQMSRKNEVVLGTLLPPSAVPSGVVWPPPSSSDFASVTALPFQPLPLDPITAKANMQVPSRSAPLLRDLALPTDPTAVRVLKRVLSNAVSFGGEVYGGAAACVAALLDADVMGVRDRVVASGLYHAMVAPVLHRALPVTCLLPEIVDGLRYPDGHVSRCVL